MKSELKTVRRPTSLAQLAQGRDNNFNLIRVIAAAGVLVSHSYVICSGNSKAEPWVGLLGMAPGGIAVDTFFALSGFLVAGSLMRSNSLPDFLLARTLRIYPALWAALLLSTLLTGLCFSSLDARHFWADAQTWRYLVRNMIMVTGGEATLPGAFAANPLPLHVNGSLWTLRWELRLYIALGLVGWWFGRKARGKAQIAPLILAGAVGFEVLTLVLSAAHRPNDSPRLAAMFFSGAAYWVYRDRVQLLARWVLVFIALMSGGAMLSPLSFEAVYRLTLPYMLLYLAYVPRGRVRQYNRVGDYSYGIYLYAGPLQQMIVALAPGISAWALSGLAFPITAAIAIASWHGLEKPALRLKHRFSRAAGVHGRPLCK